MVMTTECMIRNHHNSGTITGLVAKRTTFKFLKTSILDLPTLFVKHFTKAKIVPYAEYTSRISCYAYINGTVVISYIHGELKASASHRRRSPMRLLLGCAAA